MVSLSEFRVLVLFLDFYPYLGYHGRSRLAGTSKGGNRLATNAPVAREVASNPWGKIVYFEEWKTLQLEWLPSSKDMSDEQVKETLQLFADAGNRLRAPYLLVDVMKFGRGFTDEINAWRAEHIIPAYNSAGVRKMAFLAPEPYPETFEKGFKPAKEPGATFPTGWFSDRDNLTKWLGS